MALSDEIAMRVRRELRRQVAPAVVMVLTAFLLGFIVGLAWTRAYVDSLGRLAS